MSIQGVGESGGSHRSPPGAVCAHRGQEGRECKPGTTALHHLLAAFTRPLQGLHPIKPAPTPEGVELSHSYASPFIGLVLRGPSSSRWHARCKERGRRQTERYGEPAAFATIAVSAVSFESPARTTLQTATQGAPSYRSVSQSQTRNGSAPSAGPFFIFPVPSSYPFARPPPSICIRSGGT